MTHLIGGGESWRFGALWPALARTFRHALDGVATNCPLCAGASRGGWPCQGCLHDMCAHPPPHRCPVCALALVIGQDCPDCAALAPAFERVVTAFDYVPPVDQLILQLKSASQFHYARFMAAELASAARSAAFDTLGITIVVPVPSSRLALRRRGFNPAGEIGRQLAARLALPYRPSLLRRCGEGISQKRLSRAGRIRLQSDQYVCTGRIDDARVAVVDDVLTTGATLHAVAQALKQAGAASVTGLIVARTPYRQHS